MRSARVRWLVAVCTPALCVGLHACLHDFDRFGPGPDDATADDAARSDGRDDALFSGDVSTTCTPSAACLVEAGACAAQCRRQLAACTAACDAAPTCVTGCNTGDTNCRTRICASDCFKCTTVASCPSSAACQSAVQ